MRRILWSFLLPLGVLAVMVIVIGGISQMLAAGGQTGSIAIGVAFALVVAIGAWLLASRTRPDVPVGDTHGSH